MSDNTLIEWTDATWNPITGCTPISEGCRHCYAKRMAARQHGRNGYPDKNPFTPGVNHSNQWEKPARWKKARKIFVCSMGDLFHPVYAKADVLRVLDICAKESRHTFQILTKRPHLAKEYDFPPNVWLGTTVEDHSQYHRIHVLERTNAKLLFLSCEPLLSSLISLRDHVDNIRWVIVGQETGPYAREMSPDWARHIRDDCKALGIPFFFKNGTLDGVLHNAFPL